MATPALTPNTSETKLAANRENAQHSTGPRTTPGKATSSRNAVKHNLSSVAPVLSTEDQQAFERLLFEIKIDLAPQTHTEHVIAEQAAYAEWKLLRIAAWETEIINAHIAGKTAACMTLFGRTAQEALDRLRRYESSTRRAWHNALRELRVAKKLRNTQAFQDDRAVYVSNLKQRFEKIVEAADAAVADKTNPPVAHALSVPRPDSSGRLE